MQDTDLSVPPYNDSFDPDKNYVRVLFKPSVSTQVQELNGLQSMLQNQVEKFGDVVLQRGTVVEGCSFVYYPRYSYAKILDLQDDGEPVVMANYTGLFTRNSQNLVATVLSTSTGFESQDPDLNTLHLRYLNSGLDGNTSAYSSADVLTVYDSDQSVWAVDVPVGGVGSGFSNTDPLTFLPAIAVSVTSSNTFSNGELVTQETTLARAQVVQVNSTAVANTLVLKLRPLAVDLQNTSLTSAAWTFSANLSITSNTTGSVAVVTEVYGSGGAGQVVTDGTGRIQETVVTDRGTGFIVPPTAVVKSASATADVSTENLLAARNYLCQLTVASVANSTGDGYAFGVSSGTAYLKGFFLHVDAQVVVVSKYSTDPDGLVVGFDSTETIVTASVDPTLLDNVTGTTNSQAPGADRLQVTPTLKVLSASDAAANSDFLPLTAFSNGQPYLQNQETLFSTVGEEMARRTDDTSGDFVLDPFLVATQTTPGNNESQTFLVTVDPGYAYISGQRVRTYDNFQVEVPQATTTLSVPATRIGVQFGNYVDVREYGGAFLHTTGDAVSVRDAAASFLSNTSNAGLAPTGAGSEIGKARVRSVKHLSGTPGTPDAVMRVYLFDVQMDPGKNFRDARSLFYSGAAATGVADLVQTYDATTNTSISRISNTAGSRMVFPVGPSATADASNVTFQYRNLRTDLTCNTSGSVSVQLTGAETHPYAFGSALTSEQERDLVLVPLANGQASSNLSGSLGISSTGNTVTGTSGDFLTTRRAGDYLMVWSNTTVQDVRRVVGVGSGSSLTVDRPFTVSNTSANGVQFFPAYVPVSIWDDPDRSANVDVTGQLLTVDIGTSLSANVACALTHSVLVSSQSPVTKTSNRSALVRIQTSNNAGGTTGPWCVGLPDAFRMVSVHMSSNAATVNLASQDVTNSFYVDHNQNPDYLDLGYLYLKPRTGVTVDANTALLVELDVFTVSANGAATVTSYPIDDSQDYDALRSGTSVATLELPETWDRLGTYRDLSEQLDFRPHVQATANVTANVALSTLNPPATSYATRFGNTANPANKAYFPDPDTLAQADVSYYLPRIDRVVVDSTSAIRAVPGLPAQVPSAPPQPSDSMTIALLNAPAFPTVGQRKDQEFSDLLDRKVASQGRMTTRRATDHAVTLFADPTSGPGGSQPSGYTMAQIGTLERRIAALEYYQSLSGLESQVQAQQIPSSVYPASLRFKYGFLADSFQDNSLTDTQSPEYTAGFQDGWVVPRLDLENYGGEFNVANASTQALVTGRLVTLPYVEKVLVSQGAATAGKAANTQANTTQANTVSHPVAVDYSGVMMPTNRVLVVSRIVGDPNTYTKGNPSSAPAKNKVSVTGDEMSVADQAITISCRGLKPNTKHVFSFGGQDRSSSVVVPGGAMGGSIITDGSGKCTFTYYYGSGIVDRSTDFQQSQSTLNNVVGNMKASLVSADGTSHASCSLGVVSGSVSLPNVGLNVVNLHIVNQSRTL